MKKRKTKRMLFLTLLLCGTMLLSCGVPTVDSSQAGDIEDNKSETSSGTLSGTLLDAYTVYYIDVSDSVYESSVENWLPFKKDREIVYQSADAAKESDVQLFGKTWETTYEYSSDAPDWHGEEIRYYIVEEGTKPYKRFGVDTLSERVVAYFAGGNTAPSSEVTEESIAAANAYAKEILGEENFENYELFCDQSSPNIVYYRYYRVINGLQSEEYLSMYLTEDNEMRSYLLMNFGMFDGITSFEFDEAKAVASIEAEMQKMYEGDDWYKGYEVYSYNPVILPNGQKAYDYLVASILQHEMDGGISTGGEAFQFVIPADEQA